MISQRWNRHQGIWTHSNIGSQFKRTDGQIALCIKQKAHGKAKKKMAATVGFLTRKSCSQELWRQVVLLHATRIRLPRSSTFCTSGAREGQKDLDERLEGKILSRLMEEPALKRLKEKSASLEHFKVDQSAVTVVEEKPIEEYTLPHPIWSQHEVEIVEVTHRKPEGITDHMAYACVSTMRVVFDIFSGYTLQLKLGTLDERSVLTRCIFLETVAGVPGFAAGMIRHLHSLRRMERDHGWIHTLLEEAENERMHLMTFLQLRHPGPLFRLAVIGTQMVFTAGFTLAYLISPHFCHRFVGYLEEQAVITYSDILEKMDAGQLPMWSSLPAPEIAVNYWKLSDKALMRDVILAIRADEAHHRVVNHTLGDLNLNKQNPFGPGE